MISLPWWFAPWTGQSRINTITTKPTVSGLHLTHAQRSAAVKLEPLDPARRRLTESLEKISKKIQENSTGKIQSRPQSRQWPTKLGQDSLLLGSRWVNCPTSRYLLFYPAGSVLGCDCGLAGCPSIKRVNNYITLRLGHSNDPCLTASVTRSWPTLRFKHLYSNLYIHLLKINNSRVQNF